MTEQYIGMGEDIIRKKALDAGLVFVVSTLDIKESDDLMKAVANELLIPDPTPIIINKQQ